LRRYHDEEWGVPRHDDPYLFELLLLETMQAGLSWSTVLAKRENYRQTLDGFDAERIAAYGDDDVERLMADAGLIRHRQKVRSLVTNAGAYLRLRAEEGSLGEYVWGWAERAERGELAARMSKDLRRRGFAFVGPTTVEAYLQAVGVLDDHAPGCDRS
jgi:DNA-3-methyladenine glycosylase I